MVSCTDVLRWNHDMIAYCLQTCCSASCAMLQDRSDHSECQTCMLSFMLPTGTHDIVQELHLFHMCGLDGSFLAAASPTLRNLHMDGLPDFRARILLHGL